MGAYLGNNKKLKIMINNVAFKIQPGKITKCDHEYTSTVIAPTCTAQGYTKYTCASCGSTYNGNYVAKLDHVVVTIPGYSATTEAPGLTDGQKCSACGTILKAQEIIPIIPTPGEEECAHTDTDYRDEDVFDATCTEDGHYWQVEYCTNCTKDLNREYITTDALGHSWGAWETIQTPTEESAGLERRKCLTCEETEDHMLDPITPEHTHTEETLAAIAATCTSAGLTEGKKCSTCGETLVAQVVIDIDPNNHIGEEVPGGTAESHLEYNCCHKVVNTAHEYTEDSGVEYKAATCTTNRKNYRKCACGYNPQLIAYVIEVEDSKLPHTPGDEATCTEPQECTVCHETLVEALGHTPGTAATCTTDQICTVCNVVINPATGHVDKDPHDYICDVCHEDLCTEATHTLVILPAVAATCTTSGLTEGKQCSRCNDITVPQQVIPATGHTEFIDAEVAATCTTTGLTEGKHCSVCNEVLVAQKETEMLEHNYEFTANWIGSDDSDGCELTAVWECSSCHTKEEETIELTPSTREEATCAEDGWYACVGDINGEQYTCPHTHKISATGRHTEVIDEAVDATCTATGLTEGSHCSVCDKILVEQEETEMLDHDFVGGSCYVCGQPEHIFGGDNEPCYCERHQTYEHVWGDTVEEGDNRATCEIDGYYDVVRYCSRPGCEEKEVLDTIYEEGGHILGEGGYCTRCGEYMDEHIFGGDLPACYCGVHEIYEHSWVEATCDEPKTCSVCKITEGEPLGHNWRDATCTEPKTCSVCKITEGEAKSHKWVGGECEVCGAVCGCIEEPDTAEIIDCQCTTCGREVEHEWGDTEKVDVNPASCTIDGSYREVQYCKNCPAENDLGLVDLPATGHPSWESGECTVCGTQCGCTTVKNGYCTTCGTHYHSLIDATCTEPKHCEYCDYTSGDALGHSWIDATCTAPKTCSVCEATEGNKLPHPSWESGECTVCGTQCECETIEDGYCIVCGTHYHEYQEATCTEPKKCEYCEATSGAALGHTPGEPSLEDTDDNMCDCDEVIYCTMCNKELSRKTVPNHAWGDGDMDPACTCTNCGYHNDEDIDDNCYCYKCENDFHHFVDGKCTNGVCEAECDHDYSQSCVCSICGHENHTFELNTDGVGQCIDCPTYCPHDYVVDGHCLDCSQDGVHD